MIILRDISLRRADKLLLHGANATLLPGQRLALTGPNGCGKSSLFALLRGELTLDGGDIEGLKGLAIAHMEQDVPALKDSALLFVMDGDAAVSQLHRRLQQEEESGDFEAAALTHQALAQCDGYEAPARAARLLHGLGFSDDDSERAVAEFSGGWRVRLALARALMAPSDLLLLDEPTNHLDIDTVLWLQEFLRAYRGTLLIISHDRDFIDACCDGVLRVEAQRLDSYRGGYSDFERQRALRVAEAQAQAARDSQRRADIEAFVARFRYKASKARQAQSRLKELERMSESSLAYGDSPFQFRFPEPPASRDPMLELRDAEVGYRQGQALLHGVDLALRTGDRVALLGRNGVGKTTLLRSLCGDLPLLGGERHCVQGCRIAYFDQQQIDTLDLEASALTQLQRLTPEAREQELRDFLGGFDFRGARAEMPIAPFSGGEKARLALALLAWQRPNVLVLDEPTNHLDLEARRALELALLAFAGAVMLVSHDRHLLRSTADQLLRVGDGGVSVYDGDLESYERAILRGDSSPLPRSPASGGERKAQRRDAAEARRQRRPLEQSLKRIEKALSEAESTLAKLDAELTAPSLYEPAQSNTLSDLLQRQGQLRREVEDLEEQWLQAQEALESVSDA